MSEEKRLAGERAVEYVESGMVVGIGTGTTVYHTIVKLAGRVREGLAIRGVSTSEETSALCRKLGIPLVELGSVERVDLTIDGADEVDPDLNGIKGGHGALLREKIVAVSSARNVWVVGAGKLVEALVRDVVPVEVVPIGAAKVLHRLRDRGFVAEMRREAGKPFVTDGGNHIIDLAPGRVADIHNLERELKLMTGVVECGLFLGIADTVIVARGTEIEILERRR